MTRHFSYDRMGNLVQTTDRNGQVRTYLYDALNRQVRETWLDSSGNSLNQLRTTYDAAGRSISTSDSHSSYQYSYDGANRLVQVTNTGSAGVPTVVFNYSYDAMGNRTHTTDCVNGILRGSTTYRYDELNRTVQILQSGSGVESKRVDMGYDAASQLTTLTRYNDLAGTEGVQSTYTYDAGGRLVDLTHQQGSTILAQYRYSYDAANRITRMTSPEGDNTFNYDSTGQLTGADFSYQNDEAYSYDANGNRTNAGYQTGINNRLLSDGTYTYAYDHNGNLIQQTEIATGKVTRLSWDDRNRLVSVTEQDLTGTVLMQVEYRYDVLNRRIAKIVDSDGEGTQAATIERYVYEGEHVALVFDETGLEQERYLHGPVIDQVLAGEVGGETQWALTDHQGTVRQVVDESGSVVNQVSYDSFGTITNQSNPTAFFRFGYTGREHDTETGYTYYRNRYTFNGRFISEDPIGFAAGDSNLYRYVENSPTNFVDPSGNNATASILLKAAVGAAVVDGPLPAGELVAIPLIAAAGGLILYDHVTDDDTPATQAPANVTTGNPDPCQQGPFDKIVDTAVEAIEAISEETLEVSTNSSNHTSNEFGDTTKGLPHGSKNELEKFRKEEFTADYLREQGRVVNQNPQEGGGRGNLGGDRIVDGVRTEFKRFDGSDPDKLVRKIEKNLRDGGQAPNMIIDLRGRGVTHKGAQEVINRLLGKERARHLKSIEIIGDDFSIRCRVKSK